MIRRNYLQFYIGRVAVTLAGCNDSQRNGGDPNPVLDIFPEVGKKETGWELTVQARNSHDQYTSIHDVTLIAFSEIGAEVCRTHGGDLSKSGPSERTVSVTCDRFPAIISATAEESPCDGANIQIVYWIGTDDQRGAEIPDGEFVWDTTFRECDEPLPPDRVLEKVNATEND